MHYAKSSLPRHTATPHTHTHTVRVWDTRSHDTSTHVAIKLQMPSAHCPCCCFVAAAAVEERVENISLKCVPPLECSSHALALALVLALALAPSIYGQPASLTLLLIPLLTFASFPPTPYSLPRLFRAPWALSASRPPWECVRLFLCVFFFCLIFACLSS